MSQFKIQAKPRWMAPLHKIMCAFALVVASLSHAQSSNEAYVRFYAPKDFVYEQERLPFTVELHNPTKDSLGVIRVGVQFSTLVEVIDLDSRCGRRIPDNKTQLICTLANVEAQSDYSIGFAVVGNVDDRPNFSVGVTAEPFKGNASNSDSDSGTIEVRSQESGTEGIADGSRFIEGQTLSVKVARHVLFDQDGDGVGNISEILAGSDPRNSNSLPQHNAVIDVTFLYSQKAYDFYRGKLGPMTENLVTTTNQFLRDNRVNITLRLAAMGLQVYDKPEATMQEVFDDFTAQNGEYFPDLDEIRIGTGADLMVFLHLLENPDPEDFCGNFLAPSTVLGDFYPSAHEGRLRSVLDVAPRCVSRPDIAPGLAINMGIVASRDDEPDGGTFPFSAGYITPEGIATRETQIGNAADNESLFVDRSRFSDSQRLCVFSSCGVDPNDLVNGADTVFSMNATAHLVAALTPRVQPVLDPATLIRPTAGWEAFPDLDMIIASPNGGAVKGQSAPIVVELSNDGREALHDLRIRLFANLAEAEFVTEDNQCFVLADDLTTVGESDYQTPAAGEVICYVRDLEPGQKAGFNFQVQIAEEHSPGNAVPIHLSGNANMWRLRQSEFCLPFFDSAEDAQLNGSPCPSQITKSSVPDAQEYSPLVISYDSSLLPQLVDDKLTVPYLRLFDGSLVSAMFEVEYGSETRLVLLEYRELDAGVVPAIESYYALNGELTLINVNNAGEELQVSAMLIESADPIQFAVTSSITE